MTYKHTDLRWACEFVYKGEKWTIIAPNKEEAEAAANDIRASLIEADKLAGRTK